MVRRMTVWACALVICLALAADLAVAKPNPGQAKRCRATKERCMKEADTLKARYAKATGDYKAAADALVQAKLAQAEALELLAKAYDEGVKENVGAANAAYKEAAAASTLAYKRTQDRAQEQRYRSTAQRTLAAAAATEKRLAKAAGKLKQAGDALAQAQRDHAAAIGAIADAYGASDAEAVKTATEKSATTQDLARRARGAANARDQENRHNPDKSEATWRKQTPKGVEDKLEAMIAAKKGAEIAWSALADVVVKPDVSWEKIAELGDAAKAATYDADLAGTRWSFAGEIARRKAQAAKTESAEVMEMVRELEEVHEQIIASTKQKSNAELLLRKLNRVRTNWRPEFDKEYKAALQALRDSKAKNK